MQPFFVRKHPVDGKVSLTLEGESVKLRCRWPFDRSTDEWIELSNAFCLQGYVGALSNLGIGESVTIPGVSAGTIEVTLTEHGVRLHMMDAQNERPTQYEREFEAVLSDLLPANG
jgi:hypothetical protein